MDGSRMNPMLTIMLVAGGLFLGMLLFHEIGRLIGKSTLRRTGNEMTKGVGAAEGAVFALLGLIIAFTFSGAGDRFEARRALVTEEANAIATAYLRVGLLPPDAQPALKVQLKRYAALRSKAPHGEELKDDNPWFVASEQAEDRMWDEALAASLRPDAPPQAATVLLPALNTMFDVASTRLRATRDHPPSTIYIFLVGLSLMAALLVGYATAENSSRSWLHPVVLAGLTALSFYVILDLEFPRIGLIQVSDADQVLVDLAKSLH